MVAPSRPKSLSSLPVYPPAALRRPLPTTPSASSVLRSQRSLCCAFSRLRALNLFTSYHIPATPAVSCNYALFCPTALRYPSYFQWFPHSFYHHGGVPLRHSRRQTFRLPTRQLSCLQKLGASLSSLCTLFCIRFPCFQFCGLFSQNTRGMGTRVPTSTLKLPVPAAPTRRCCVSPLLVPSYFAGLNPFCIPSPIVPVPSSQLHFLLLQEAPL